MPDTSEELTIEQQVFARVMFVNKVLSANGQAFENLFIQVMTRRDSRFRPVKPQGSIGDQGNDGFIPEEGRYFQVYAPENPKESIGKAAEKARDDFGNLKAHWQSDTPITDYRFVFNDKYQGAYPTVEHALVNLKREHELQIAMPFLAKDLEAEFRELPTLHKIDIVGVIPRPEFIEDIDYAAMTSILQHLVDNQSPIPAQGLPQVPDFVRKIEFNDINEAATLLRIGNFQNAAVEEYFDRHGEFTRTDIRNRLATAYGNARQESDTEEISRTGDQVFFELLNQIVPNPAKQVQDAAIVLIAYFFEKCDVFEEPDE